MNVYGLLQLLTAKTFSSFARKLFWMLRAANPYWTLGGFDWWTHSSASIIDGLAWRPQVRIWENYSSTNPGLVHLFWTMAVPCSCSCSFLLISCDAASSQLGGIPALCQESNLYLVAVCPEIVGPSGKSRWNLPCLFMCLFSLCSHEDVVVVVVQLRRWK